MGEQDEDVAAIGQCLPRLLDHIIRWLTVLLFSVLDLILHRYDFIFDYTHSSYRTASSMTRRSGTNESIPSNGTQSELSPYVDDGEDDSPVLPDDPFGLGNVKSGYAIPIELKLNAYKIHHLSTCGKESKRGCNRTELTIRTGLNSGTRQTHERQEQR